MLGVKYVIAGAILLFAGGFVQNGSGSTTPKPKGGEISRYPSNSSQSVIIWDQINYYTGNALNDLMQELVSTPKAQAALGDLEKYLKDKAAKGRRGKSRWAVPMLTTIGTALKSFAGSGAGKALINGAAGEVGKGGAKGIMDLILGGGGDGGGGGANTNTNTNNISFHLPDWPTQAPLSEFEPIPDVNLLERPSWCDTECDCEWGTIRCPIGSCPPIADIEEEKEPTCIKRIDCPPGCISVEDKEVIYEGTSKPESSDEEDDEDSDVSTTTTTKKPKNKKRRYKKDRIGEKLTDSEKKKLKYYEKLLETLYPDKELREKLSDVLEALEPEKVTPKMVEDVNKVLAFFGDKKATSGGKHRTGLMTPNKVDIQEFLNRLNILIANMGKKVQDLSCHCPKERCDTMLDTKTCDYTCPNNPGCVNLKCACRMPDLIPRS